MHLKNVTILKRKKKSQKKKKKNWGKQLKPEDARNDLNNNSLNKK